MPQPYNPDEFRIFDPNDLKPDIEAIIGAAIVVGIIIGVLWALTIDWSIALDIKKATFTLT